jgi:hypothetical protein
MNNTNTISSKRGEFKYSADDFPTIVANILAIENQAQPQENIQHVSVILNNPIAIKLTHRLFVVSCLSSFHPIPSNNFCRRKHLQPKTKIKVLCLMFF